jgi:translation initiation factor 1A
MVKNTKGGNKHKKYARKNVKQNNFDERVRKAIEFEEMYASVSKVLGNGRVEILCNDGVTRHCVIRNKFRGRNKRDNHISVGSIILVGARDWQTPNSLRKEVCDLLFVYSDGQIDKLKSDPKINMALLKSTSNTVFDTNIEFFNKDLPPSDSSEEEDDDEDEIETKAGEITIEEDEIDVDDI